MRKPGPILLVPGGILAAIFLLFAVAVFTLTQLSRNRLAACRAELEKRGETFAITRLAPPPQESPGARDLLAAAGAVNTAKNQAGLKPFALSQPSPSPEIFHLRASVKQGTNEISWEEMRTLLAPLQPHFAEVERLAGSNDLTVHPNYAEGFAMKLPFLSPFLSSAQLLAADALLALHDGRTTDATDRIEGILLLASLTEKQPILISRLLTLSMAGLAMNLTWELIQAPTSSADLLSVQNAWEALRFDEETATILRIERATGAPAFAANLTTIRSLASLSPAGKPGVGWEELLEMARWGVWSAVFRHADQENYLRVIQALIDPLEAGAGWKSVLAEGAAQQSRLAGRGLSAALTEQSLPPILGTLEKVAGMASLRSLGLTALALRRFQNDHDGKLPENLEALTPDYLSTLPRDPMTGQPVRYVRAGGTFLLYAVGLDGIDDGANPEPPSGKTFRGPIDGRDIVWPQPSVGPPRRAPAAPGAKSPAEIPRS